MLDVRYSHLYFYQSLNRLQRGLSAIAELLVIISSVVSLHLLHAMINILMPGLHILKSAH